MLKSILRRQQQTTVNASFNRETSPNISLPSSVFYNRIDSLSRSFLSALDFVTSDIL